MRIDVSGYYVHASELPAPVWKRLRELSKVAPVLNDRSPAAKRARSSGRGAGGPQLGKSFHVTTDVEGGYTWIPRAWFETMPELIRFRPEITAHRIAHIERTRLPERRTCAFTLKPNQVEVLNEVFSYGGVTSGCLALHTGFGKTVVAMEIIARLNVRVLWLSHTTQLLKQSSERAQTILSASVGSLTDDDMGAGKDFVTCTIQSLLKRDIPVDVLNSFGLLVVDEVHHMSAPSFSQALHKVGGIPYTIGLSATLERKDGLEKVFQWSIGPVLSVRYLEVRVVPEVWVVQKGWEVEIKLGRGGDPIFAQAISDMARIPDYNQTVVNTLKRVLADADRKILVLTDRKEHVLLMHAMLQADPFFATLRIGTLHGDMTERAIEETLHPEEPIQVLLGTYGICGEGFDCPGLNAVCMATPRNDIRQAVGRVLGERVGSVRPLIVDIRNTLGLFYNQGRERVKFYQASGFDVKTIKIRSADDMLSAETVSSSEEEEPPASSGAPGASVCCFVEDD
jgi:superfamily II DNA or RNA helicase